MIKVVTIGGGTGQFMVLSALREIEGIDISAVVTMADSGGSSGQLRDEYGVLPPGDVLQCLIALSPLSDARKILRKRFSQHERLRGHTAGNLLLVFLTQFLNNDFASAIEGMGEILHVKGTVLPVTLDKATLAAELVDGSFVYSEMQIDVVRDKDRAAIKRLFIVPHQGEIKINPLVAEELITAEYIIISPGDLYSSVIPNFIVPGVVAAIKQSGATIVYLPNLMTKNGETSDYQAHHFVEAIERYIEKQIDLVVYNKTKPSDEVLKKYIEERASWVDSDAAYNWGSRTYWERDLLSPGQLVRHDTAKVQALFQELF